VQLAATQSDRPFDVTSEDLARLTDEEFGLVSINAEFNSNAMKAILDKERPRPRLMIKNAFAYCRMKQGHRKRGRTCQ